MTLDQVIAALVRSTNGSADDVLLEAVRVGAPTEAARALGGLFQRGTAAALAGIVARYADLPTELRPLVADRVGQLDEAVRDAGRTGDADARRSAVRLIADSRQAALAGILTENLRHADPAVAVAASAALVAFAEWIAAGVRSLQAGEGGDDGTTEATKVPELTGVTDVMDVLDEDAPSPPHPVTASPTHDRLTRDRADIEQAVVKALEQQRERPAGDRVMMDVVRAAVLLCDHTGSRLVAVLRGTRHAGQAMLARRVSGTPGADAVDAFLVGAGHGGQRSSFANSFARIADAPTLDGLLRRTHWLKDAMLGTCMASVSRGAWWTDGELARDAAARHADDVARVGRWIAASGTDAGVQDDRLVVLYRRLLSADPDNVAARSELLRTTLSRPRGTSTALVTAYLADPDERLVRMAVREIHRRRPADHNAVLMTRLATAPGTARPVVARAVGQAAFEQFWANFDQMDAARRRAGGRGLLKLLPDVPARIVRRMATAGANVAVFDRLKALQMIADLGVAQSVSGVLIRLCGDASPRVRSKAVALLREVPAASLDVLLERLLNDPDARVRANAVEVMDERTTGRATVSATFVPTLVQRARTGSNRERANAIRALHRLRMADVADALNHMLADGRVEHRISGLWAVRETGLWNLAGRVGQMAKADAEPRVRQYAMGVLRAVSTMIQQQQEQRRAG